MKILIMGLPGSGKTTLANSLVNSYTNAGKAVLWLNADNIRTVFNDWDFSEEGRLRQAHRMRRLCNGSEDDIKIVDFVAPLKSMRDIFQADFTIWVDTIVKSRFDDTNVIFEKPDNVDLHVTSKNAEYWSEVIKNQIALGINK